MNVRVQRELRDPDQVAGWLCTATTSDTLGCTCMVICSSSPTRGVTSSVTPIGTIWGTNSVVTVAPTPSTICTSFSAMKNTWLRTTLISAWWLRVNYGGKRYLFTAHNDTNICDPEVGVWADGSPRFTNPYQGLYVTVEELSFYNAY